MVEPYLTAEELAEIVRRADEAGHQVAIHAIGDRALDVAFDGLEGALGGAPNVRRHRIEHNSVVRPDQYARYGELGVVATIFGDYPSCSPIGGPLLPEVQDWEWPYDELMAANPGARFAWHGDAPYFSIDPLHQLFGFVTRHDVADDGSICAPHAYLADDVIPVEVALRLMTVESAYALFREMEVGSLRPGWLADLIVIDGNPLLVDPFSIKDLTVRMTMVGGEVVHCLDEELCP